MKSKLLCSLLALGACATLQAGTYSLVGYDLVPVATTTNAGTASVTPSATDVKISTTGSYGTIPGKRTFAQAFQNVIGTMRWIVHWTPSYVGEPVPGSGTLVTFRATGDASISATSGLPAGPGTGSYAEGLLQNNFFTQVIYAPTTGTNTWSVGPSYNWGVQYGGTSSFTETFPGSGVYEGTISLGVNHVSRETAQVTSAGVPSAASCSINMTIKIEKIDSQFM